MSPNERALYLLHARSPRFQRLLSSTVGIVEEALSRCQSPYAAWSGGKDSTVMLDILRRRVPGIAVAFFDSGAEFPDVLTYIERLSAEWNLNLTWIEPAHSILDLYRMAGMFGSGERKPLADGELKRILIDDPARTMEAQGHDAAFIGLRAEESKTRKLNVATHGTIHAMARSGVLHVQPLARWTARDVWAYLVSEGVPWCPVYDKPWPGGREAIRVGAYAGSTVKTLANGRWAFMRRHYPEVWRRFAAEFPGVRNCS